MNKIKKLTTKSYFRSLSVGAIGQPKLITAARMSIYYLFYQIRYVWKDYRSSASTN